MEVVAADDDFGVAGGYLLDGFAPLAGGFEGGLDGFGAGVHGERHLEAGEVVEVFVEERELVVAEGARREGELLGLFAHGAIDGGMAVALIDGRVGSETVEIFVAFYVVDPGAGGTFDDDVQRVIVVCAVALFEGDQFRGEQGCIRSKRWF